MMDGASLGDLTMEGIARTAGVGKATIYRRWPNKDALLVDVVFRMNDPDPELAGVSARDDLVVLLDAMRLRGLAKRSTWWVMAAFSQLNSLPELKQAYHDRVIDRRRRIIREVAERGVATGEFRADLDPELLGDLLVGPMLARTVLWNDSPLDDPDLPATMVDALLAGLGGPAHLPEPGRSLPRRNPV